MRNVLSAILFAVIFVGLGALVFASMPSDNADVAVQTDINAVEEIAAVSEPEVVAGAPALAPAAPKTNFIAMPLISSVVTDALSLSNNMTGLVSAVKFNAATQAVDFFAPPSTGTNFPVAVGDVVIVSVDATADTVFTVVGDVPAQESVTFNLEGDTTCQTNFISIPLDRSDITDASDLAADLGDVQSIVQFNAATQSVDFFAPPSTGTDFPVQIGYPYIVCIGGTDRVWPTYP